MIRSEEKLKGLASILNKDNNIIITEAISLLREEQPFEGAIGLLASFYNRTDDFNIRKSIEQFMNDIKDQSACEEVINEIRKPLKDDTISMLVSSCWQSGLDYSDYTADLAEVFLRGDYITAIECLTVIEESVMYLTPVKINEIRNTITSGSGTMINEKKSLVEELFVILDR